MAPMILHNIYIDHGIHWEIQLPHETDENEEVAPTESITNGRQLGNL